MTIVASSTEEALASLLDQHRPALLAQTVRYTGGDRAWAEDIVQECFLKAWQRLERMTDDHGSVRAWLTRVAHNLAVDGHRSARCRFVGVHDTAEVVSTPIEDISRTVLNTIDIERALSSLSAGHRAVLEEVYLRDQSIEVAARRLDIPIGTVKSRVFYALRELRKATSGWVR